MRVSTMSRKRQKRRSKQTVELERRLSSRDRKKLNADQNALCQFPTEPLEIEEHSRARWFPFENHADEE